MGTLTNSLNLIGQDIVQVLKDNRNKAMTQDELFAGRKLMHYSEFGWSFAIEKLEKKNLIKVYDSDYKNNDDLKYILA